ncbi:Tol-Pal system beta propeller repeat protein TolB [Steroidobacter sp.]|uniref:Tol-Pal system beta propeller repeat protein TolB n=1 Tax=Steroidobacter sp. TaxID=1978227 RepID=UPI001A4AF7FD|nr:Tol-Pal system beta propeller repeat protein TolB [Steroidobacter sp.]MBL8265299.1 Tol-Pal system beta propeller repeat protein TolB [Steroidobacter sp.]
MKKTVAVFACWVLSWFAVAANAQLVIEITKSAENAVPIAIVPFGWESSGAAPFDVAEVVAADLRRSGRFEPMDRKTMIDRPSAGDQIRFQDWRYLKTDFITVGKLIPEGTGYAAQFELYNVLTGQRLEGQKLTAQANSLRALSHRISDIIFEKLTGVRGAFSTRVAFINVEGTPPKQRYKLIVADYDGENQQIITTSDEPLMSPAWSPDAQSLAYVSFESKASAIYVQTLRTGERKRVSARAGINGAPAWSPDGKTLALTLSRKDGDVDVYTLNLASQVLTRMSFDPGIDTEPSWSADGNKLYFMSDRAGGPQIYQVDVANPSRPTRISFEGNYNARPRVSPDGKQLAVVHNDRGNYRIAVIDLASKGLQVLSQGRQDESPSFAPNGATLIYATQERGRGVLATVSVDGRTEERLSNTSGEVREPVWAPFAR